MKKVLMAVLMAASFGVISAELPPVDMNQHVINEGQYWINGVPNEAQRYTVFCGAVRSDQMDNIPAVTSMVFTTANDLDYVYAMAGAKGCAQIVNEIIEKTAELIGDTSGEGPAAVFVNGLMGAGE